MYLSTNKCNITQSLLFLDICCLASLISLTTSVSFILSELYLFFKLKENLLYLASVIT